METFTLKSSDEADIFVRAWYPQTVLQLKGVVQISHGMAEHSLRYDWFAAQLSEQGYAVYANDHRGHGETAYSDEDLGHFSDENGWGRVVNDMKALNDFILDKHKGSPVFLFGHSMGSFLSRDFIAQHGNVLSGAIFSGTAGNPGLLGKLGLMVAKSQAAIKGKKKPSHLMDKLSFGAFNKPFSPARTAFDWLSRDPKQVDRYIEDKYCGFVCTSQFYVDLLSGIIKINSEAHFNKTPDSLPIYLFSGSHDPVGENGKSVKKAYAGFKKAGVKDLSLKFYDQGRHEMLNDINKEEVASDVIGWLNARITTK